MTKLTKILGPTFLFISVVLVIFLIQVFSGRIILPQTFNIGSLSIHYYGLIMALAVASAFYLALKRASDYGIDFNLAEDLMFWIVLGGFIGARLYHVLSSFSYYTNNPADIIKVWNGGLSIYGAVIGGFIVIIGYLKAGRGPTLQKDNQIFTILNWLAPSIILGQIIGRFGNLFNYEAFGYPASLPWKMFVPENFRPAQYSSSAFFHPWFLYEALINLFILIFLVWKSKKNPKAPLFIYYLLLYNVGRFFLEFLRIDSTFIGGFRLNAIVSLVLVIASAVLIIYTPKHDQAS